MSIIERVVPCSECKYACEREDGKYRCKRKMFREGTYLPKNFYCAKGEEDEEKVEAKIEERYERLRNMGTQGWSSDSLW